MDLHWPTTDCGFKVIQQSFCAYKRYQNRQQLNMFQICNRAYVADVPAYTGKMQHAHSYEERSTDSRKKMPLGPLPQPTSGGLKLSSSTITKVCFRFSGGKLCKYGMNHTNLDILRNMSAYVYKHPYGVAACAQPDMPCRSKEVYINCSVNAWACQNSHLSFSTYAYIPQYVCRKNTHTTHLIHLQSLLHFSDLDKSALVNHFVSFEWGIQKRNPWFHYSTSQKTNTAVTA